MDTQASRPIVVGVDGSPDAARALQWAMDEAERQGSRLLLVHGVEIGAAASSPYGGGEVLEQLQTAGEVVLAEARAVVETRGLPVDTKLEIGSGAHALIDASRQASMVVVGSRGHGGFVGMLLGSVSNACVHHAHCPVVVVRPEASRAA